MEREGWTVKLNYKVWDQSNSSTELCIAVLEM